MVQTHTPSSTCITHHHRHMNLNTKQIYWRNSFCKHIQTSMYLTNWTIKSRILEKYHCIMDIYEYHVYWVKEKENKHNKHILYKFKVRFDWGKMKIEEENNRFESESEQRECWMLMLILTFLKSPPARLNNLFIVCIVERNCLGTEELPWKRRTSESYFKWAISLINQISLSIRLH